MYSMTYKSRSKIYNIGKAELIELYIYEKKATRKISKN